MATRWRLIGSLTLVSLVSVAWVAARAAPAAAVGSKASKLQKGPYLTTLSDSSVDVRFELDRPAAAVVEAVLDGHDAGAPLRFEDRAVTDMHVVHLTGLNALARYSYTVRTAAAPIGGGRFTTAPRPGSGAPLTFLVYGDDRTDPVAHAAVVRALVAAPSDFLVNTGDIVEDGGRPADWQSFFDIESALLRDRALFVAIGNHELYDDWSGGNFARYLGFPGGDGEPHPYGTVRLSNVRFFFLNATHDWSSGEERRWLELELSRADGEDGLVWRIAVLHHGPWSSGPHGGNAMLAQAHVPELLAAHGVDLVLAGHDHIYERGESGGLKYVTSGGGGAPLYPVVRKLPSTRIAESTHHYVEVTTSGTALALAARRIDGSVIERCGFPKGRPWDCDAPPDAGEAALSKKHDSSGARCACTAPGSRGAAPVGTLLVSAVLVAACWARRAARARRRRVDQPAPAAIAGNTPARQLL